MKTAAILFLGSMTIGAAAHGADEIPGSGAWMARVLFDASQQSDAVIVGRFETAEACLKAANDRVLDMGISIRSGPECGRDCTITDATRGRWECAEIRH